MREKRIIISGGGTGGHIFPAISIANALKRVEPDCEILFVGALGRMEMEKVPAAGYRIAGLPVIGLKRSLSLSNLKLPFMFVKSIIEAGRIIKKFKPDAAVGVGGYASFPLLKAASLKKIPYIIQEQNSYAGVTNKLLAKKASKICVAYEGMEKFFPAGKILLTGNPVRSTIKRATPQEQMDAKAGYGFGTETPVLLVVGGSLGAGTLNTAVKKWILENAQSNIGIIWQCGKYYYDQSVLFNQSNPRSFVQCFEFISNMEEALAAADVVISRAGAGTISELCIAGKATIFVPSPNVAEDHQTANAMALTSKGAALMVRDNEAPSILMAEAMKLLNDRDTIEKLEKSMLGMALYGSDEKIAGQVLSLINSSKEGEKL